MTHYVFTNDVADASVVSAQALSALNAGRLTAAVNLYLRAIALRPEKASFHNNCGVALMRLNRLDEAQRAFRRAIELDRNYGDPLVNLATALITLQEQRDAVDSPSCKSSGFTLELEEAERLLRLALQCDGDRLDALLALAYVLERKRCLRECLEALKRARPLHPDPIAISNLISNAYLKVSDWAGAAERLEFILQTERDNLELIDRLGECYGRLGQLDKAQVCFQKAATINDRRPALRWRQLGFAPAYFQSTDEIDEYWRKLDVALDAAIAEGTQFDWRSLPSEGGIPPFQLAHFGKCCRAIKEKFARLYAPSFIRVRDSRSRRRARGKIRVGFFVSPLEIDGFVRSMAGIINRIDSRRFESLVFHRPQSSAFLSRTISGATLVDVSDSFETAVERIRETACDAIHYWKVGGSTWNYFMPILRLAPVQSLAWGGHGTSGVFDVDYYLSYKNAEIANAQESYTERLVLMDEMPAYRSLNLSFVESSREELGLPSSGALYFCPHRLAKYHPEFDEYLMEILEADPRGAIMATLGERDDFESEQIRARIERNVGPALAKRMIFLPRLSRTEYARFLSAATVELDSSVYSSCLTLYDALSLGTPCVSQVGELLVQRFTATAYSDMTIENAPIARNREEYVRFAVELGTNADYRRALSQQILERRNCVFERPDAAREFERFWERAVDEVQ